MSRLFNIENSSRSFDPPKFAQLEYESMANQIDNKKMIFKIE